MTKTYTSFQEAAIAMGSKVSTKKAKAPTKKCFRCGGVMNLIEGTNVFACTGKIELKDKDGNVTGKRDCGNTVLVTK